MKDNIVIAIDGPSGVGKSTIAKLLSERLDIAYVDTGAMYRAVAYAVNEMQMDTEDDEKLNDFLQHLSLTYSGGNLLYDNKNVEPFIRTEEMSVMASKLSQKEIIRDFLVKRQKELAKEQSVIMEGRDIGTVVLPDATVKFYLTANEETRAKRRLEQYISKGDTSSNMETVLKDIQVRDYQDMHREHSPLKVAEGAIVIDNTLCTLEETIEKMLHIIEEKQ